MLSVAYPRPCFLGASPFDAMLHHPLHLLAAAPQLDVFAARSAVELAEADGAAYVITVKIPGVKTADLTLSCDDGVLTVAGETQSSGRYASVERQVRLPADADADAATVKHEDGLIHVTVPKKQSLGPLTLDIALTAEQPEADETHYQLALEVPGIAPQDLSVSVDQGEVKVEGKTTRHGIEYAINRRFRLPRDAEAASSAAALAHGILTVSVPKAARPAARKLKIDQVESGSGAAAEAVEGADAHGDAQAVPRSE